jgi:type VI secretion system secreted protein Hcp
MNRSLFLKLDGVRGASTEPRHFGSIELAGFTWGNERRSVPSSMAGTGSFRISDLTVFKLPDESSPVLRSASASGKHFPEATVTVEEFSKTGELESTAVIKLESIMVEFVAAGGSNPRTARGTTEAVALSFANYQMSRFTNQKSEVQ